MPWIYNLRVILGVGLFGVALSFLRAREQKDVRRMNVPIEEEYGGELAWAHLPTTQGASTAKSGIAPKDASSLASGACL